MLNYCECLDWLGYVISWEFLKVILYCATPSKHKAFRHQKLEKIITVSYETEISNIDYRNRKFFRSTANKVLKCNNSWSHLLSNLYGCQNNSKCNVKQTVHPLTKFYSQAPSWTSSFKFHQNVKLIWTVKTNKKKNIKNDNGYMHKYIQRENKKEIERKNFLLWS